MILIVTTSAVVFAIIIGIAIAIIVFVNYRDFRAFKKFLADQEEARRMMESETANPLFKEVQSKKILEHEEVQFL